MTKDQQIITKVRSYILQNFIGSRKLSDDDLLIEHGIIDSIGILDLIGYLENEFGIAVQDEELVPENFQSVIRIAYFVGQKSA